MAVVARGRRAVTHLRVRERWRAADALDVGLEAARDRARDLAGRLRADLPRVPGLTVLDRGPELAAIVTVSVAGHEPPELMRALRARGINTTGPPAVE